MPKSKKNQGKAKLSKKTKEAAAQNLAKATEIDFFKFPKEIRLIILSYTCLVVRKQACHRLPGLRIRDGVILSNQRGIIPCLCFSCDWDDKAGYSRNNPPPCPCHSHPNSILEVRNKLFHSEAKEILLSHNRLVFEPQEPQQILQWLKAQGDLVRWIRQVDIQFSFFNQRSRSLEYYKWKKKSNPQTRGWNAAVAYIRDKLCLPQLELAIDASLDVGVAELVNRQVDYPKMLACYRKMVAPLHGLGPRHRLKRFEAFFATNHKEELDAERRVMGDDYPPSEKLRAVDRIPGQPRAHRSHGAVPESHRPVDWPDEHELYHRHQHRHSEDDFNDDYLDEFEFDFDGFNGFGFDASESDEEAIAATYGWGFS